MRVRILCWCFCGVLGLRKYQHRILTLNHVWDLESEGQW